jgi:hypothetical protein
MALFLACVALLSLMSCEDECCSGHGCKHPEKCGQSHDCCDNPDCGKCCKNDANGIPICKAKATTDSTQHKPDSTQHKPDSTHKPAY